MPTEPQPHPPAPPAPSAATAEPTPPVATDASPPLTPEEQMELFAQELKETDWGHQPC